MINNIDLTKIPTKTNFQDLSSKNWIKVQLSQNPDVLGKIQVRSRDQQLKNK
jgi:hypothetical protein